MTDERSDRRGAPGEADDRSSQQGSDRASDRTGGRIGRRRALKGIGAGVAMAGGLFAAPGTTSAAGEGVAVTPDEVEPPNPDIQVRKVARDVERLSQYYPILTLSEGTVLDRIEESGLSRREQRKARRALFDLRSEYPVVEKRDGNVTWLTLANDRPTPGKDDSDRFQVAGKAYAKGAAGGRSDDGISTQQWGGIHESMTRNACEEMGIGSDATDELVAYSDAPDDPDVDVNVPDWIPHADTVEDGVENALNEVLHHYGQYLDTDAFEVYHDDDHEENLEDLGGARAAADWHMDRAHYYGGSTENKYLGKAVHYPQDMGVPLHTGMGWEQANLDIYYDIWSGQYDWSIDPIYWLHSEYEEFVNDEWWWFEYDFESDCGSDCFYYYPIDDVSESIWDLASYSGDYSYEVFHRIQEEGDVDWTNWSSSTEDYMRDLTENCVHETGHYTRGFIHDVKW